ncbi:hypothetical protein B0H16DRAFT_1455123 [Mycena metata]|uniref:Uncharacterized protein n=1 Tax=Mycena metata TaxID=1033252 RepID=A0AAD7JFS3_9AGAR|nr:hypothetical protein B0H16DRAFT_1455123 [Mycena metata]
MPPKYLYAHQPEKYGNESSKIIPCTVVLNAGRWGFYSLRSPGAMAMIFFRGAGRQSPDNKSHTRDGGASNAGRWGFDSFRRPGAMAMISFRGRAGNPLTTKAIRKTENFRGGSHSTVYQAKLPTRETFWLNFGSESRLHMSISFGENFEWVLSAWRRDISLRTSDRRPKQTSFRANNRTARLPAPLLGLGLLRCGNRLKIFGAVYLTCDHIDSIRRPRSPHAANPPMGYAARNSWTTTARLPKRFVHLLGPPLDLALDALGSGGRGRWVQSGCWLNADVRVFVCPAVGGRRARQKWGGDVGGGEGRDGGQLCEGGEGGEGDDECRTHFWILATRALKEGEETTQRTTPAQLANVLHTHGSGVRLYTSIVDFHTSCTRATVDVSASIQGIEDNAWERAEARVRRGVGGGERGRRARRPRMSHHPRNRRRRLPAGAIVPGSISMRVREKMSVGMGYGYGHADAGASASRAGDERLLRAGARGGPGHPSYMSSSSSTAASREIVTRRGKSRRRERKRAGRDLSAEDAQTVEGRHCGQYPSSAACVSLADGDADGDASAAGAGQGEGKAGAQDEAMDVDTSLSRPSMENLHFPLPVDERMLLVFERISNCRSHESSSIVGFQ